MWQYLQMNNKALYGQPLVRFPEFNRPKQVQCVNTINNSVAGAGVDMSGMGVTGKCAVSWLAWA
jgi:hypothetical protein